MSDALQKFFISYRDAFNAFDARRIAEHFTIPAALSDDGGPQVFMSFEALVEKFETYCRYFHEIGYVDGEFETAAVKQLDASSVMTELQWRLDTTSETRHFRSVYLCQQVDDRWKIFCAQAYQPPED